MSPSTPSRAGPLKAWENCDPQYRILTRSQAKQLDLQAGEAKPVLSTASIVKDDASMLTGFTGHVIKEDNGFDPVALTPTVKTTGLGKGTSQLKGLLKSPKKRGRGHPSCGGRSLTMEDRLASARPTSRQVVTTVAGNLQKSLEGRNESFDRDSEDNRSTSLGEMKAYDLNGNNNALELELDGSTLHEHASKISKTVVYSVSSDSYASQTPHLVSDNGSDSSVDFGSSTASEVDSNVDSGSDTGSESDASSQVHNDIDSNTNFEDVCDAYQGWTFDDLKEEVNKLNNEVVNLTEAKRASDVVASVVVKGLALPTLDENPTPLVTDPALLTALSNTIEDFSMQTGRLKDLGTLQEQATRASQMIKVVLLKKKEDIKSTFRGYTVSTFIRNVGGLIPELMLLTDVVRFSVEDQTAVMDITWNLLIWIVKSCLDQNFDYSALNWTVLGIEAMNQFDMLMAQVFAKKVDLIPNQCRPNSVPLKYYFTDWVNAGLLDIHGVATEVERDGLGSGEFLHMTIAQMGCFLSEAYQQVAFRVQAKTKEVDNDTDKMEVDDDFVAKW